MLEEKVSQALSEGLLLSCEAFRPLPAVTERGVWEALDNETKAYYAGVSDKFFQYPLPALPAMRYMDFVKNGDRHLFEKSYFERRTALFTLLVCECIYNTGKYLPDIINLVWAICEETTWVIPAHNGQSIMMQKKDHTLGDILEQPPYVDLFSAETAALLGMVKYLLEKKLNAETEMLVKRIQIEVNKRVLTSYLVRDDMRYMGFADSAPVNNWNPWINSNVLYAALFLEENDERRQKLVLRAAKSVDRFLAFYHEDGGCDEGPGYFNAAGGAVLDCLEILDYALQGKVDFYSEPLLKNMAQYIMFANIKGKSYINFADAHARVLTDGMLLRRAAKNMQLEDLEAFADSLIQNGDGEPPYSSSSFLCFRKLKNLLTFRREDIGSARSLMPLSHSFDGIQVAFARENGDGSGLYFAAKGGNNSESHNHNDIGNYIVYLDGAPVIIDVGVETYRRETFSAERYTIWTMQSRYHNTAILSAGDQCPGAEYRGKNYSFTDDNSTAVFKVDMAPAYSEFAHVERYERTITLNRAPAEITIHDEFTLGDAREPVVLPIMLAYEPRLAPGECQLGAGRRVVRLSYDETQFSASVEKIPLTDDKLLNDWQKPMLYRLLLTRREGCLEGEHIIRLRAL